MFKEDDVFLINDKEYKLRLIDDNNHYWMETILVRYQGYFVSGGRNIILSYDELTKCEQVDWK